MTAPKTALDRLAKAKLHGSLRDACVTVLGGAFFAGSSKILSPQGYVLFALGVALSLLGVLFLGLRMYRSFREGEER